MAKTVVIYGGGFQPFHQGHLSSYLQAKKAFPGADFYVAASADVKQRPIPYEEKKFLATQAGVAPEDFPDIVVKSPLNPKEILSKYNPNEDVFVLVRSERDPVGYTKKDGSPAYYQPYQGHKGLQPFSKHGYVYVTDKKDFKLNGETVFSGTQVRDMYANADTQSRLNMVKQLYPKSKEQKKIKQILDKYIAGNVKENLLRLIKKLKPIIKEGTLEQKQKFYNLLKEAKGHLDHPEDLVFLNGTQGVSQALNAILATIKNPKTITIKWDGYPALIFGHGPDGKFSIMDKHMFNRKDGAGRKVHSPEQFLQYDVARGADRGDLANLISSIWPGLEKASQGTKGYYWGDLLFGQPLKDTNGLYKFKANPNGIAYTVDVDSEVGKLLSGKSAGIAVHQYLKPDSVTTDQATALNGSIGQLKNNSDVAIVPSAMPVVPKLKVNKELVGDVKSALSNYKKDIDNLLNTAPQAKSAFSSLFTTYINKRIVSGNLNNLADGFMKFIETRPMTAKMKEKLTNHFNANKEGIIGAFTVWSAIYNLKNDIVNQLASEAENSPVKGYLQSGKQSQEGFVSQGLKFVDRMGFSRQNLEKQRANESVDYLPEK